MIRSMTGFGRGDVTRDGRKVAVEVKTVNHRYTEVVIRLPRQFQVLEERIRSMISEQIKRGRIEVFVSIEELGGGNHELAVDKALALNYYKALKELAEALEIPMEINLHQISLYPEVISYKEAEVDLELVWGIVAEALQEALSALIVMREAEGQKLYHDLVMRMGKIEKYISQIEAQAPEAVRLYREKLQGKIKELIGDSGIDEGRILQEAAVFAERINITEELVRLSSHIRQFIAALESCEPVGRKLDFILQEMNREINTIGSKANDYQISQPVVEVKSEIEKVREQTQNIE